MYSSISKLAIAGQLIETVCDVRYGVVISHHKIAPILVDQSQNHQWQWHKLTLNLHKQLYKRVESHTIE